MSSVIMHWMVWRVPLVAPLSRKADASAIFLLNVDLAIIRHPMMLPVPLVHLGCDICVGVASAPGPPASARKLSVRIDRARSVMC